MPPSGALGGIPVVSTGGLLDPISPVARPSKSSGPSVTPPGVSVTPLGISVTETLANLLPLASSPVPLTPTGVYIGNSLAQSPPKLSCQI